MPDDDDRPRDASSAADPGSSDPTQDTAWSSATAPDDIRTLAADIAAYRREQRATRHRELLRRLFAHRGVPTLSLTLAGLALAAVVATLLTVMTPDAASKGPTALPLAHPSAKPGQLHGLLPNVTLRDSGGKPVGSLALRPGVLALIPVNCQCSGILNSLAGDAYSETLPLIVVAPMLADADAAALSGRLTRGNAQIYYDKAGALADAFGAQGITLVLLDRDGTIFHVQRAVSSEASSQLNAQLQAMLMPTARTGD